MATLDSLPRPIAEPAAERFSTYSRHIRTLIQAELKLSKEGRLFRQLLEKDGLANNGIEHFNRWVDVILPQQIAARVIQTPTGVVRFSDVVVDKPKILDRSISSTGVWRDLTPEMARARGATYNAAVSVTATMTPIVTREGVAPQVTSAEKIPIGSIPILVGSNRCHLWGKTAEQLIAMGEDPNDPFGYFIIKGGEKSIIIQEKLRESMFFTFCCDKKGRIETRTTVVTPTGTSIVTMLSGKRWAALKVGLHHMRQDHHIPLFVVFEFIGFNINQAYEKIMQYIPVEKRNAVHYQLQASIAKAMSVQDKVGYLAKKRQLAGTGKDANQIAAELKADILKDLFANLPTPDRKADQLARMTAQMFGALLNYRALDDRDSSGNKRYVTAAGSCEQLLNGLWGKIIDNAHAMIKEGKAKQQNARGLVDAVIHAHVLTDDFETAFGSNAWGVKGSWSKENITESLKRETMVSTISQVGRVNTPASRKAKTASLRMIHGTYAGYICPFETPEGDSVGLVKNLASLCYLSLKRDLTELDQLIRTDPNVTQHLSMVQSVQFPLAFIVNGQRYYWCNKGAVPAMIKARRRGSISKDVCIFYNQTDNQVEFYCDASRPTRPLLVVENNALVIDTKNLWDQPIAVLLKEGALEYIDAREQEFYYVAMTTNDVRERQARKDHLDLRTKLINDNMRDGNEDRKALQDSIARILPAELLAIVGKELTETKQTWAAILLETREELVRWNAAMPYDYAMIDPIQDHGVSGGLIPQANCSQGPRNTYQAAMAKQALGHYHFRADKRWDSAFKILINATRPLFETEVAEPVGLNTTPSGRTPIVAIGAHKNNNEDSIIATAEYLATNNFNVIKYVTHKSILQNTKETQEQFARPESKRGEPDGRYAAIDAYGLPRLGAYIRQGDCIIGKVRHVSLSGSRANGCTVGPGGRAGCIPTGTFGSGGAKKIENASLYAGVGEEGYVDRVFITWTIKGQRVVKVKIRQRRNYRAGDKLASRYAQKGTIGSVVPACEMPRVVGGPNDGLVPDFLINPHSIPSRMTMGKMKEMLASKAALFTGERVDATTFQTVPLEHYQQVLRDNGCDPNGWEYMADPNGKQLNTRFFVAPCYYQGLRHHVLDKAQVRALGAIKPINHQPVGGRANEGGLRVGEMERDSMASHGASGWLLERLMVMSDKYRTVFCRTCGNIAICTHLKKQYICRVCGDRAKFGVLTFPHIFKLITQNLVAMGINVLLKMIPIIPEDGRDEERFLN